MSPSVTPWRWPDSKFSFARNPALRMYDFDPTQLHLTNIKQYYLELPKANEYVCFFTSCIFGRKVDKILDNVTSMVTK